MVKSGQKVQKDKLEKSNKNPLPAQLDRGNSKIGGKEDQGRRRGGGDGVYALCKYVLSTLHSQSR